ncbi:phage head-tail connector protein [Anaeromassilibacillus senegalensis]|uniref:phage head-tail connector protein n=1 Tax=Anaeromassilibacillus senegalensis TaxID=1673717 RepID=UPI00067FB91F|nr:phage head-tail connector protein [Anaeromassilibacillus senegalensis]
MDSCVYASLEAQLPDVPFEQLEALVADAEAVVKQMTRRNDVSAYEAGVRAVAVLLYNRIGREGETAHSSGGVSVSYEELPMAVRHLLPQPLASIAGKRFERNVETEPAK